ncbi:MAG: nicotinate-nucleotide adenylyltransferase [Prevotella sp.]|nr:nicotinate-nucleotide adenylyltransferase [Prevotella sp.]
MRIGIFGGSFNPIHRGHIALARQLLKAARLDEIWLMVTPLNPFKQQDADLLDDHLRLQMAEKALESEPRLKASDYEFHLPKPSYTWQTLQALSHDYRQHQFTLLIGADNWASFDRWYHHEDLLKNYPIVVYPREGSPVDEASLPDGVTTVNTRLYRISSTEIRRRIRQGKPVKRLLPAQILEMATEFYSATGKKDADNSNHPTV